MDDFRIRCVRKKTITKNKELSLLTAVSLVIQYARYTARKWVIPVSGNQIRHEKQHLENHKLLCGRYFMSHYQLYSPLLVLKLPHFTSFLDSLKVTAQI